MGLMGAQPIAPLCPEGPPRRHSPRAMAGLLLVLLVLLAAPVARGQGAGSNATGASGAATGLPVAEDATAGAIAADDRSQRPPSLPDSEEWERFATRAEAVIEAGRASIATLEQLRGELAGWRTRFRDARSANATRIETVTAQIAALGPPPADGAVEAREIALRRRQLEDALAELATPRLAAEEAWSRADALIRNIDALIRDRHASELLRLGASPLNPAHWPAAVREARMTVAALMREGAASWQSEAGRTDLRDRLPVVLGLLLLAAVALGWAPRWVRAGAGRLALGRSQQAGQLIGFARSVLQLLLAGVGLSALRQAAVAVVTGFRGSILVDALIALGLLLLAVGWLARRTFPRRAEPTALLTLSPARRAEGRFFALTLAATLWGVWLVRRVAQIEGWSEASGAIWQFPLLVLAGVALLRLGQLMGARAGDGTAAAPAVPESRRQALRLLGRALALLGVAGPILAAIGYQAGAIYLTLPAALTLGLLALLVQVQFLLSELYGLATGRSGATLAASIVPVLIAILLAVAALPVLALIWGARVADLSEFWSRTQAGLVVGDTRISPGMFLTLLVVFAVGFGLTRLLQGTLRSAVLPKTRLDAGAQSAIVSGVGYLGIGLAGLLALTSTGISFTSLAVVFGALSVGIGFGLQNVVQNFVAGIIMLVERPVAVGDWIEVGGNQGIVRQISVRSTRIEAFDRTSVIVPNADFISGPVRNWTRGNLLGRLTIPVAIAHGADTQRVVTLLREEVEAHPQVMLEPAPSVLFDSFGPDGLNFTVYAVVPNVNFGGMVGSDLRHAIVRRLAAEGIEFARARRDVRLSPSAADAGRGAAGEGAGAGQRMA